MQRSKAGGGFKKPDVSQFVPPELADAVDRVVAAGHKIMYSPDMREELRAEVQRDAPTPQKLAEAVVGLLLTLDKQAKGGIPNGALFPAAIKLLGEGADLLSAAGQAVSQEDFNEAARMSFVLIGTKLGAKPEQIMQAAQGSVPRGAPAMENEPGEGMQHETDEGPAVERQEDDGMDEEDQ